MCRGIYAKIRRLFGGTGDKVGWVDPSTTIKQQKNGVLSSGLGLGLSNKVSPLPPLASTMLVGAERAQTKFLWTVGLLQLVVVGIYGLMFRYNEEAHPFKHNHQVNTFGRYCN